MNKKFNYSAYRREATVDAALADAEKVKIWEWLNKHAEYRFTRNCKLDRHEAQDVCSNMYAKLMSKDFSKAFPNGYPKNDRALWAYLSKAVHFEQMHVSAQQKRLPALGEPLEDEDGDSISWEDRYEDMKCEMPNSELHFERPLVARALDIACKRHGYGKQTVQIARSALLKDASVGELAKRHGILPNAVSQIKSRVTSVMREEGPWILAALESVAA